MLPDYWEAPGSGRQDLLEDPASWEEQRDEEPCDGSGIVARADTALADVEREAFEAGWETHRESPPSSSADALPDHWEAPASSGRDLREEPSSLEEQHEEKPYDRSGMVAHAGCTSDTAWAHVKSEVKSGDASLVGKSMHGLGEVHSQGCPAGSVHVEGAAQGTALRPVSRSQGGQHRKWRLHLAGAPM
ncbi:uncharacterized protein LOC144132539 [Amblyomma americanum]